MKRAGPDTFARLAPLLEALRALSVLRENTTGAFYLRSRGFLHFHEEGEDIFADVRLDDDWVRLPATSRAQQDALLKKIRKRLALSAARSPG